MNVTLARRLVGLARRAYARADPAGAAPGSRARSTRSTTPAFTGFAASDEHAAYLVFRGTKLHLDSGDLFRRTLQAWLANLDFAQVEERAAGMVHRGYARELDGLAGLLLEMARDHAAGRQAGLRHRPQRRRRPGDAGRPPPARGGGRRPGGGGVLGPARRRPALRRQLSPAAAADRAPARSDPASAAAALARVPGLGRGLIDPLIEAVGLASARCCRAPASARTEYVHAGELLYDDGAATLYRVPPGHYLRRFGPILLRELQADLLGRGAPPRGRGYRATACPRWATPVPARLMDGVRLPATLAQIGRQMRQRRLDFLLDHHIDGALAFIDRIERPRG